MTTGIGYSRHRAVVVVEARASTLHGETTTMIIIGIILGFVGLAYLCWLLFALAVHALPLFAAVAVGLAAYHSAPDLSERSLSA
jgi:hypothetical protein